jgi:hypothetical protein
VVTREPIGDLAAGVSVAVAQDRLRHVFEGIRRADDGNDAARLGERPERGEVLGPILVD